MKRNSGCFGRSTVVGIWLIAIIIIAIPTFLNTTGSEQSYLWLVYIYRTDNLGHAFGETPKSRVPFPIGAVEQRANGTWKLTGGGECENFIARLAWINQDNQPIPFTKSDGQVYELPFTVCP